MASVYGYVFLVVGLSLLLGLAGVDSGIGGTITKFVQASTDPITGEFSLSFTNLNQFLNDFWGTWQSLLAIGATIVGVALVVATKDFGQGMKAGVSGVIGGLIIGDFIGIMTLDVGGTFGVLVDIVSWVIYLPLLITFFIIIPTWIGGGS